MKEGGGISQRTYTHKPWTWTAVWGWPEAVSGTRFRWAKGEKVRTTVTA